VEHLLLRAETLLHASADALDRQRRERRRERERIVRGLQDLQDPLLEMRQDWIQLVEAMAAASAPGLSPLVQARLEAQLPRLERVLIALERVLSHCGDPPLPVAEAGRGRRSAHPDQESGSL